MIYLFLTVVLVVFGLMVTAALRVFRASSPERSEMLLQPRKKTVGFMAGLVVTSLVAAGAMIYSLFWSASGRAIDAAKDYLEAQHGRQSTWRITAGNHIERSKTPPAGSYQIHYRFGEETGDLVAEYFERDGKLVFKIIPREK